MTPLRPATYTFEQEGFACVDGQTNDVPSRGTLVADPPTDDGQQVWRRFIDVGAPSSDVTQQWMPEGVRLLTGVQRQVLADQPIELSCTFPEPMLVVPWHIEAGITAVTTCDCLVVQPTLTSVVVGPEQIRLGDEELEVWIIESVLESPPPFKSRGMQRDWVSWDLASLYVKQHVSLDIDIFGVAIHNEIVATLINDEATVNALAAGRA